MRLGGRIGGEKRRKAGSRNILAVKKNTFIGKWQHIQFVENYWTTNKIRTQYSMNSIKKKEQWF